MAKLRKKVVVTKRFWKINAFRPEIKAKRGRMWKFKNRDNANLGKIAHLQPPVRSQFLIPQTAIFCIAMDAKKHSSFAARIKKRSKKHEKYF